MAGTGYIYFGESSKRWTARVTFGKSQKMPTRSRLPAAPRVESASSPMKKDPDHNSTDFAEIEALITRLERGQIRDVDAQSPSCHLSTQKGSAYDKIY